jgi:hypothetical protein
VIKNFRTFENSESSDVITEYIVGFPSGEVIVVSPIDLAKLKTLHLIKYNQKTKYFVFQDGNYNNIRKAIQDPFKIQYIHHIMDKIDVSKYKINVDFTVDVEGDVDLSQIRLSKIPIKFGMVKGNFDCSHNKLTNLVNCPDKIMGFFNCAGNNIHTLIGGPTYIGKGYYCEDNSLEDLQGYPKHCLIYFNCSWNKIKTLEGLPEELNVGLFDISYNKLKNLKNGPKKTKNFDCSNNLIETLEDGIKEIQGNFNCSNNALTNLSGMPFCNKMIYLEGNEIDELEYD